MWHLSLGINVNTSMLTLQNISLLLETLKQEISSSQSTRLCTKICGGATVTTTDHNEIVAKYMTNAEKHPVKDESLISGP